MTFTIGILCMRIVSNENFVKTFSAAKRKQKAQVIQQKTFARKYSLSK